MSNWKYHRFSAGNVMLALNLPKAVPDGFGTVPRAVAMYRALQATGTFESLKVISHRDVVGEDGEVTRIQSERDIGAPSGPLHEPQAWRGTFTVGGHDFKVQSVFGYPKMGGRAFLGLSCKMLSGTHDTDAFEAFIDEVNAMEISLEEETPPEPNLVFVSGEMGGGRFGYSSIAREDFGIMTAGSLEGSQGGVHALFEDTPGDGSRALWLITDPYINVTSVSVGSDTDFVSRVLDDSTQFVYKVEPGEVQWPSRTDREAGIKVRITLEDGRILHPDGGWRAEA